MVESGSHHSKPEWKLGSLLTLLGHALEAAVDDQVCISLTKCYV